MLPDTNNSWWQVYMTPLLQTFIANNITSSLRWQAYGIMTNVYLTAKGFGQPTELTAREIANTFNVTDTNVTKALKALEELRIIRRDPSGGKGNPLIITPLSPDHWRLPNGSKLNRVSNFKSHLNTPDNDIKLNESIDEQMYNNIASIAMQEKWRPIFEKIYSYIEITPDLTATDPSKLLGVMATILTYTSVEGEACSLHQKAIGQRIKQNEASIRKTVERLELAGVLKRDRSHVGMKLTAIFPTSES